CPAQEKQREQRPLFRPAQRQRSAVDPDLDRAEDQELHSNDLSTSARRFPDSCKSSGAPSMPLLPTERSRQLSTRARVLALALLTAVVAVSSALAQTASAGTPPAA